jgi:hypothetical protein
MGSPTKTAADHLLIAAARQGDEGAFGPLALARHHRRWIRPVEEWECAPAVNGNPPCIDQFSSLLRHLLARYEIPSFMAAAFFEGVDARASQQQEWFLHVANGGNFRELDTPIRLTRRMAHLLLFGSEQHRYPIEHHLRWAQVVGMGGDRMLARTILRTRLGRQFDHDEFWSAVVLFLANNAMMVPDCVGPLVDYVYNMKFASRRFVRAEGGVEEAPPPQPNFTMKVRSATKLLRQVEAWHGHLNREQHVVFQSWPPCGLRSHEVVEETERLGPVRWTVQELRQVRGSGGCSRAKTKGVEPALGSAPLVQVELFSGHDIEAPAPAVGSRLWRRLDDLRPRQAFDEGARCLFGADDGRAAAGDIQLDSDDGDWHTVDFHGLLLPAFHKSQITIDKKIPAVKQKTGMPAPGAPPSPAPQFHQRAQHGLPARAAAG